MLGVSTSKEPWLWSRNLIVAVEETHGFDVELSMDGRDLKWHQYHRSDNNDGIEIPVFWERSVWCSALTELNSVDCNGTTIRYKTFI